MMLAPSFTAQAQEPQNMLYLGVGADDVFDSPDAAVLDVEWRPSPRYLGLIAPLAGGFVTSEGSFYGYVGFGLDFTVTERVSVMPFTGAGLYGKGSGPDLGQALEFRSGLEVMYRLEGGRQIGAQLYHLSNAGLDDKNPGNNYITVKYGMPLAAVAELIP